VSSSLIVYSHRLSERRRIRYVLASDSPESAASTTLTFPPMMSPPNGSETGERAWPTTAPGAREGGEDLSVGPRSRIEGVLRVETPPRSKWVGGRRRRRCCCCRSHPSPVPLVLLEDRPSRIL